MLAGRSMANYGNFPTILFRVIHEQVVVLIQLIGSDLRR